MAVDAAVDYLGAVPTKSMIQLHCLSPSLWMEAGTGSVASGGVSEETIV